MMMKKKMRKVLSCIVVIAILMSTIPVAVFAVNDSNNTTDNASDYSIPDDTMPVIYLNDTGATILTHVVNDTVKAKSVIETAAGENNISGDCAPIPDVTMPVIHLNDTCAIVTKKYVGPPPTEITKDEAIEILMKEIMKPASSAERLSAFMLSQPLQKNDVVSSESGNESTIESNAWFVVTTHLHNQPMEQMEPL